MLRVITFIIVVAALVAGAVWLADRPGAVTIVWQGWRLETSVPVLLVVLLLVMMALSLLFRLWRWLRGLPGRIAGRRRERRRRKGYAALTGGLAAVAAGDQRQAARLSRQAESLLHDPSATALLAAQAADLSGDEEAAKAHFESMLDRPETALTGLRGLTAVALKEGDRAAALSYAERAFALNPAAAGVAATLFDLQVRAGQWAAALETLKAKAFPPETARRMRAVVLTECAGDAADSGASAEAERFAKQAVALDAGFVPAARRLAGIHAAAGRTRKAAGVLEKAWAASPHPDLAAAYLDLWPDEDALARMRHMEKLVRPNADDTDSRLAVARAALDARLWGRARDHLMTAAEARPTAETFRLLARLEREEKGDAAAEQAWLERAADAPHGAGWQCRQCGAPAPDWAAFCAACGGFDTLAAASPVTPARAAIRA